MKQKEELTIRTAVRSASQLAKRIQGEIKRLKTRYPQFFPVAWHHLKK